MNESLKFFLICMGFMPIAWLLLAGSVVTYAIYADWRDVQRRQKAAEAKASNASAGAARPQEDSQP